MIDKALRVGPFKLSTMSASSVKSHAADVNELWGLKLKSGLMLFLIVLGALCVKHAFMTGLEVFRGCRSRALSDHKVVS